MMAATIVLAWGASTLSGNTSSGASRSRSASNKSIYTRQQIAQLYSQHRRGYYNGREAEWARIDADIIAAGREGRILGGVDVLGK
jgi:hypothetical protein